MYNSYSGDHHSNATDNTPFRQHCFLCDIKTMQDLCYATNKECHGLTAASASLNKETEPSRLEINRAWPRAVLESGEYTKLAVSDSLPLGAGVRVSRTKDCMSPRFVLEK